MQEESQGRPLAYELIYHLGQSADLVESWCINDVVRGSPKVVFMVLAGLPSIFKGGGDAVIACWPIFCVIWFYYGNGVGVDWEDIIIWAF